MAEATWGRFSDFWARVVHPTASREQVTAAFALLAGGLVLAFLGVLLFILGDLVLERPSWLREVGSMAAAMGLPLFLAGLVVALPSRPWTRGLAGGGLAFTALAVVLFSILYPQSWTLQVAVPSLYAIVAYLVGATALSGAAAAEVANYFVQRSTRGTAAGAAGDEVSDADIASDLDWARKQGWSWGGVRPQAEGVKLVLKDETRAEFIGRGKQVLTIERAAGAVDQAATALSTLRGRTPGRLVESDAVHDQVSALKALQAQKAVDEAARRSRWWWRLLHPFAH